MKQIVVAFLIVLTAGMAGISQANDLTFNGDVSIAGAGNGLTFPDGTKQVTANPPANLVLECVTAELLYEPKEQPVYCSDPVSVTIVNPYPSQLDPNEIFSVFCEAPSPYGDDDVAWGLRCKSGWMNTGCAGTNFGENDMDIAQFLNGCHSDDDEYGNGNIFTTCCRIAVKIE